MTCQVKLVSVSGDQEEFGDMIGTTGTLCLHESSKSRDLNWYHATHGDVIGLSRKRVTQADATVKVSTDLDNTFTFKKLT